MVHRIYQGGRGDLKYLVVLIILIEISKNQVLLPVMMTYKCLKCRAKSMERNQKMHNS